MSNSPPSKLKAIEHHISEKSLKMQKFNTYFVESELCINKLKY